MNPADQTFSRRQFAAQVGGYSLAAGGAMPGACCFATAGDGRGQAPRRYGSRIIPHAAVSRPNMIIVRSSPVLPGELCFEGRRAESPRRAGLQDGQGRHGRDGRGDSFIQKGDVVVIKPNVAFDKNPDLAATTHPNRHGSDPALLGGGARKVIVADNPINNPESCFYKTKVGEAAFGRCRADDAQG